MFFIIWVFSCVLCSFFFCLETKETKIQGYIFFSYNYFASAKSFEPAYRQAGSLALKRQMIFNAYSYNLLNAKR